MSSNLYGTHVSSHSALLENNSNVGYESLDYLITDIIRNHQCPRSSAG
jgi:hypothetical protein